jgi:hypothetical protein
MRHTRYLLESHSTPVISILNLDLDGHFSNGGALRNGATRVASDWSPFQQSHFIIAVANFDCTTILILIIIFMIVVGATISYKRVSVSPTLGLSVLAVPKAGRIGHNELERQQTGKTCYC